METRKIVNILLSAALAMPLLGTPASAAARGAPRGAYGVGFHSGGFYGGGFRSGVVVGPGPYWYDPFWPYPYSYSYPYPYPPAVIPNGTPDVEGQSPPAQNWYSCDNPQGYYPYVASCNGMWHAVPTTPPPPPAG